MDPLKAVINNSASPVGLAVNLAVVLFALGAVPKLPPQLSWLQTNYLAQVVLVGLLFYRNRLFGDNLNTSVLAAAGTVSALNWLNGQPVFGNLGAGFSLGLK